jgi:hypothetical protein
MAPGGKIWPAAPWPARRRTGPFPAPIYHISLDDGRPVLVAEPDLGGALLDLVTAVLAIGGQVDRTQPPVPGSAGRSAAAVTGARGRRAGRSWSWVRRRSPGSARRG